MLDLASEAAGGKVLMVSSLDADHPGGNVIDGGLDSYWMSTGLYPQEILLELGRRCPVSNVQLSSTSVRHIRIEGCQEPAPLNFHKLAETSFRDPQGQLQSEQVQCQQQDAHMCFVRVVILSGWHDFCSVRQIRVEVPESIADTLPPVGPPVAAPKHDVPPVGHEPAATVQGGPKQLQWIEQVRRDGLALRFAQEFAADREVVLAAVQQSGDALQFASDGLREDREVVLAAVQKKGSAIRWASAQLQMDREVGLEAVRQNGKALQFCGANLRADRAVVLAAVEQHGSALQWAKPDLRRDREVSDVASRTFFWTKRELAELEEAEDEDEDEDDLSDN